MIPRQTFYRLVTWWAERVGLPRPMKRLTVSAMPDLPRGIHHFKCPVCKTTFPSTMWTPQEARRYGREGEGMKCEGCYMTFQGAEIVWDERDG